MKQRVLNRPPLAGIFAILMGTGGCVVAAAVDVTPSRQPYAFLAENAIFRPHFGSLYPKEERKEQLRLAAFISKPDGYKVCFSESGQPWVVNDKSGQPNTFRTGVYPFRLYKEPPGKTAGAFTSCQEAEAAEEFTGALVVFNLNRSVELATFGRSDETVLFSPDLLEKVRSGFLTSYTISFDNRPRIVYWIGNRKSVQKGGQPTVELDFSKNPDLEEVWINGDKVKGFLATVPVYGEETRGAGPTKLEHWLSMRLKDGTEYRGYVRNLEDNAYTTFMRVPCAIPKDLFDAAKKGTIAKLNVLSEGETRSQIAEIVFGLARRTGE